MKITCSRRDDIIKQRDEFDTRRKSLRSQQEKDEQNARQATLSVFKEVEDAVKARLKPVSKLPLDVRVRHGRYDGMEVNVECGGPHTDGLALAWNYRVYLNDEVDVVKETGSWSGLSATTAEEMMSLKRSIRALEILNEEIDWEELIKTAVPRYEDFMTQDYSELRNPRPDFEGQLREADIEEAIQSGKPIHGKAVASTGYREGIPGEYTILKETPKSYVVDFRPDSYPEQSSGETRVSKSKLLSALD